MSHNIKSLAALKRAITVGTRLEVVDHWQPNLIGQVRTVVRAQAESYKYIAAGLDSPSWGNHGTASQTTFPEPDTFRVDLPGAQYAQPGRFWVIRVLDGLGEIPAPPPSPVIRRTKEDRARYLPSSPYRINNEDGTFCLFRSLYLAHKHLKANKPAPTADPLAEAIASTIPEKSGGCIEGGCIDDCASWVGEPCDCLNSRESARLIDGCSETEGAQR